MSSNLRLRSSNHASPSLSLDITRSRARRISLEQQEAMWRELFVHNPAILLLIDPADGTIVEASETAAAFYGYPSDTLRSMRIDQINVLSREEIAATLCSTMEMTGSTRRFRFRHRLASGEIRAVDVYAGPVRFGDRTVLQAVVHDVTEHAVAQAERDRLVAAVEQVSESVVIADPAARIIYVNPAFERVTGYTREEVLGLNPRILKGGQHPAAFYAAMWATLTAGLTWHGELVNRRKDGSLFTEEVSITPVVDASGALLHYVAVKRDVTAALALQARLDESTVERTSIAAILMDLVPGDTAEATATAICDRLLTVPAVAFASLARFLPGDRAQPLAAVAIDRVAVPAVEPDGPWPPAMRRRIRHLFDLVEAGPSVDTDLSATDSPMASTYERLGITGVALVPIRVDGASLGFLTVGAAGEDAVAMLESTLPILTAFGTVASLLLGRQLGEQARVEDRRQAIQAVIDGHQYRPVFQPIVALASGNVVGFEALTRFADGTSPETRFAEAASVGLGLELELATLEAALRAARVLPEAAWLDLNVSPGLLDDGARLRRLLWPADPRTIVLEITEHEAIADYRQLRSSLDALGIPVRLAVDDAGAGFASLRHILELRPDTIKLDRSLVTDIDADAVRQGLVAGLRHFASIAGATVVAEGIETRGERAALMALGVELGQGYLLGRPGPAAKVRDHVFRPSERRTANLASKPPVGSPPDLVHRVNAILWEADGTDERMTFVSESALSMTGHAPSRWLDERGFWDRHVHPDDRAAVLVSLGDAMTGAHPVALEYRFRTADGGYRWFEDLVEVLPTANGHSRLVGVMVDVTDRRMLADQLAHRATHDPLTDLLNRQGFDEALARALPVSRSRSAAVLFMDLDDFKVVNDSLGHRDGDALLRIIASRLGSSTRGSDAVARFGGDEFVVFVTADDDASLIELARRLLAVVTAPTEMAGRTMAHPASLGIAFMTGNDTADSALRDADIAMYVAKHRGGNQLAVYEPAMHLAAVDRLDAYGRAGPRGDG